jgi:TIR domain
MTVYVLHAPQDLAAAEALERFLERRGHFAELQDGQMALRPVQSADVVVSLISKDFVFSPFRLQMEKRALEAWAENRLVLVKLDHNFAPVGLRDLPAIDASFEAQREFTWIEVDKAIRGKLAPKPEAPAAQEQTQSSAPPPDAGAPAPPPLERARKSAPEAPAKRGGGVWMALLGLLLMLPGLGALAVASSIFLVNRIGPRPGTAGDLIDGVDAFGLRYGAPSGVTILVFIAAIAIMLVALVMLIAGALGARSVKTRAPAEPVAAKPKPYAKPAEKAAEKEEVALGNAAADAVFVSYARANSAFVMPVIEGAKKVGRKFWLDTEAVTAGESWAGEIVRAIRTAEGVLVMCSNAAFQSDHVKREVYLADRYKKRLVPVFIEEVALPEDFEYFFAGVQWLKLHDTPEADRSAALVRALGTA